MLSEPNMRNLIKVVIPKVKAEWEELAYCMTYEIGEVNAFKRDSRNVQECCRKLLEDWLSTDHGPVPKTYKTLLNRIKEVQALNTASEKIERELIEGNDS